MPWGCLRFVIVVFPDHTHLLFLDLSITDGIVVSKMYDKLFFFNEIVNFPFLDGDCRRYPSYGVYLFSLRENVLMLLTSTTETIFNF